MKCKSDFGIARDLTLQKLDRGEAFRFINGSEPMLRGGDDKFTSFLDGSYRDGLPDWKVVRIRIDRVEDGLPVFVDA